MAVYGLKPVKISGDYQLTDVIVKSGSTVTAGDPIFLEDNRADLAAAGEQVFGMAMSTVVGDGTLTTPVLTGTDIVYQIDNDNLVNTFNASGYGAGKYFDIIGATGAVLIDTSSAGTTGQFSCIDSTPDTADTSLGHFRINKAESQA